MGTVENPGIAVLTMRRIFDKIEEKQDERNYQVKFSFLEIYNETIRDLLGADPTIVLDLREDPINGLSVAGLSEHNVNKTEDIQKLVLLGNKNRTQDANSMNLISSRSHAVFQVTVEHSDKCAGIEAEVKVAKLSLIDLAGSERTARNNIKGTRQVEGANINRSLLALGNCINKLSGQITKGIKHIPYRDSKLTRLLKDSLGGNCQTIMIANISPSNISYEDTHNTLKYAIRAKNIKTSVQKNVVNVQFHVSQYAQIISQLKQEVMLLKSQLSNAPPVPKKHIEQTEPETENLSDGLEEMRGIFREESNIRKKIFNNKQLQNTAKFNNNSEVPELNENEISLQQKLKEIKENENILLTKLKNIPNKHSSTILTNQFNHYDELSSQIPIDSEANCNEVDKFLSLNNMIILKLKEQIKLRDTILEKAKTQCEGPDDASLPENPKLIKYSEMLHLPNNDETASLSLVSMPTLKSPPGTIRRENLEKPNLKNFRKPPLPGKKLMLQLKQYEDSQNTPSAKAKILNREKRSNSVFHSNQSSSNVSQSTAIKNNKISFVNKVAKHIQQVEAKYTRKNLHKDSPRNHRLQENGAQIVGGYRKYRSERPHKYSPLKEIKPSILAKPDKAIFKYLNKNKND